MPKIVLDTNVLVSALIQKSFPYLIVYHFYFEGKFELCVSKDLLIEYLDVLNRDKFSRFPDFKAKAELVLAHIASNASFFEPKKKVKKLRDPDDDMILELAQECKADYIVTGNTKDFTISKFKKTLIVTPAEYWELHRPE
jgi:putative PIN family toxin of toxin-antitoxin system